MVGGRGGGGEGRGGQADSPELSCPKGVAEPETKAEKGQTFSPRQIRIVLTETTPGQDC